MMLYKMNEWNNPVGATPEEIGKAQLQNHSGAEILDEVKRRVLISKGKDYYKITDIEIYSSLDRIEFKELTPEDLEG